MDKFILHSRKTDITTIILMHAVEMLDVILKLTILFEICIFPVVKT